MVTPEELVRSIVCALVETPDAVTVRSVTGERIRVLQVSVRSGELGPVIGREGRTAEAIRRVAHAVGHRHGVSVHVEFLDGSRREVSAVGQRVPPAS